MRRHLTILLLILLLGLALRIYPALKSPGIFAEPDVYIYYSVAAQTLANHMVITSQLSGVPPVPYSEFPGLVLVPAYLSWLTGIPLNEIFEYLPVLMGLLGIVVTYLIMYEFMHKHWVANFAAFLYAVLPAAIYRGMAGEWRGGVFVAVFLAIALLFLMKTTRKTAFWTVPGAILFLAASVWFWSGGVYVLVIAALYAAAAVIFTLLPRFIKATGSNPLLRNRLTYVIIFILLPVGYLALLHIAYFGSLLNGYFSFQASFIEELAPTSAGALFISFAWVFPAAIMGLGLMIFLDRKETFHQSQFAMFAAFLPTIIMASIEIRWISLFTVPACIYAAYLVYALVTITKASERRTLIVVIGLSAIALLAGLYFMLPLVPSDSLNTQFLSALSWLKANTPSNATVLTLWPDGSVVEGYADRESYTDSIMSMDSSVSVAFERFLFEPAGNYSYMRNFSNSYLIVRRTWISEVPGMLLQSGLPLNTSYNGTNFQQLLQINGTAPPPFQVVFRNNDTIIYKIG